MRNWVGERFGRLVVIAVEEGRKARCVCDCGQETIVHRTNLGRPNTRSCGCIKKEFYESGGARSTHGKAKSPEYRSWQMMKNRCLNPNAENYAYYGGRGIVVCKKWIDSFQAFYDDMGPRPSTNHSIERRDNSGNYEPENCYWATCQEQARNRRPKTPAGKGTVEQYVQSWNTYVGAPQ